MTVLLARLYAPAPLPLPPAAPSAGLSVGSATAKQRAAAAAASAWAVLAPVVAGGGLAAGRVRVSRDGGRSYPRSRERALSTVLPDQPAAVRVYSDDGTARCLVADLDVGRGGLEQVQRDVDVLLGLLSRCGGRAFTDSSPLGGRHVYLPLAVPVGHHELRPVLYALAALLPSLDVAPGVNLLAGCIRPPGARHKSGGWQRLDGSLAAATLIAQVPNGPAVWAALTAALRPQLRALEPARTDPALGMPSGAAGAAGPKETRAAQAAPARSGGPRRLRPAVLQVARTGTYDTDRYPSPSEGRQGVLAAAAASGWTLPDVLEQIESGAWPGLWSLYARYADRHRREALAGDWLNALTYARESAAAGPAPLGRRATAKPSGPEPSIHVHRADTREPTTHRGGSTPSLSVSVDDRTATGSRQAGSVLEGYQFLRAWWTAVRLAERDRYPGRAGLSRRLVLRALGNAGQKTGRRHLAFGVRSLAIAAGLSRTTVAIELRALRAERDPLVSLLVDGRGLNGDLYELRIPDTYADQARTMAWRPGRIEALLPCFRILGVPAAFVYEQLDRQPQSSWDLAASALLSPRAAQHALAELAAHHLAVRTRYGWTRGPADPATVAHTLGADQLVADQVDRYRTERDAWRTRLNAHPVPTLIDLSDRAVPKYNLTIEATPPRWLPQQPQPPPNQHLDISRSDATAVDLVLHVLGGTVLRRLEASVPTGRPASP